MSDTWSVITVVLLAVLVGGLVPVFYQTILTLKSARRFFDTTGPGIGKALRDFGETAERLNRIGAGLEEHGARLKPLVDTAAGIGQTLHGMRQSLRSAGVVLGALSPALLAGVSAFFAARGRGDGVESDSADLAADEAPPSGGARRKGEVERGN